MTWYQSTIDFIWEALKSEFVTVVAGVIFAQVIQRLWNELRFGRWKIMVVHNEEEILRRKISTNKAKEILGEESELAVFIKGVTSPYAWLNCDPIEKGRQIGLLVENRKARVFSIHLEKNPTKPAALEMEAA